jgi:phage shock protein E
MNHISPNEARTLIENNKEIIILDVRTLEEFQINHLDNAINIDIYNTNFKDQIDKLERNKSYLVHCKAGGRSEEACRIMEELGFKDLTNVLGFLFPPLK